MDYKNSDLPWCANCIFGKTEEENGERNLHCIRIGIPRLENDFCGLHDWKPTEQEVSEKQIPLEVTEVHVDEYRCPACGSKNNCNDRIVEDNYCPECGQRIFQNNSTREEM